MAIKEFEMTEIGEEDGLLRVEMAGVWEVHTFCIRTFLRWRVTKLLCQILPSLLIRQVSGGSERGIIDENRWRR